MSTIFFTLKLLLELLPDIFLSFLPFSNRFRYPSSTVALISIAIISGICIIPYYAANVLPLDYLYAYYPAFFLAFQIFLALALLKASAFQILFTVFIVKNYMDAVSVFHLYLEYYWNGTLHTLYHLENCLLPLSTILIISFPVIRFFIAKLLQPVLALNEPTPLWRFLWVIPLSFYIIYRISPYTGYGKTPTHADILLQISWTLVSFLSYYIILCILLKTMESITLREDLRVSAARLSMQEKQYEKMLSSIEKMHESRVELRRHLLKIKRLAHYRDAPGIQNYLKHSLAVLSSENCAALCDNHAADAVIRHYTDLARKNGISVLTSLELPEKLPIAVNDLCIVLGNLLENALEACLRQSTGERFIKLKARTGNKNMIIISIKNSFDHKICLNGTLFLSSKRSGEGIGTASIQNIADKYWGIAKFNYTGHVFQASVLLNGVSSPNIKNYDNAY